MDADIFGFPDSDGKTTVEKQVDQTNRKIHNIRDHSHSLSDPRASATSVFIRVLSYGAALTSLQRIAQA